MNLTKQKTIRFKVVKASSRYSCMVHGSTKYALKYEPGTDVYAIEGTLGVMCFDTYENAMKLIHQHYYFGRNCMVIKVQPMGRGYRPKEVGSPTRLDDYYKKIDWYRSLIPPAGTICYPGVHVLT
jgi:hypothetical protein